MESVVYIFSLLIEYSEPFIFFGAFFFGETVIITAAFLSAQDVFSLSVVFLLSLFGTLVADILWFFAGRYVLSVTHRFKKYEEKYHPFLERLAELYGRSPFLSLLFIKFLYGTRILTILFLSIRKVPFRTFLIYDTIGTVIWLTVIVALGFVAGRTIGIEAAISSFHKVEIGLVLLVVVLIAFRFGTKWITKRWSKQLPKE